MADLMAERSEGTVLRLGWVWFAPGVVFVALAALFPLLLWLNHESFNLRIELACAVLAVIGIAMFLSARAYAVRMLDDGFVLSRLGSRPRDVRWSEVRAVHVQGGDILFETADGKVHKS